MLHLIGPAKGIQAVACSGGPDSMAALSYLSRGGMSKIKAVFFHHQTESSEKAKEFLLTEGKQWYSELIIGYLSGNRTKTQSPEEFWREERYKFLDSLNIRIATGHNLNDVAETYLLGCIAGTPKLIPYARNQIVRPLIINTKAQLVNWCLVKKVAYVIDATNHDTKYRRNRIRVKVLPEIMDMTNGGFMSMIRRKYIKKFKMEMDNE